MRLCDGVCDLLQQLGTRYCVMECPEYGKSSCTSAHYIGEEAFLPDGRTIGEFGLEEFDEESKYYEAMIDQEMRDSYE